MKTVKSGFVFALLIVLLSVAAVCTVSKLLAAHAQNTGTISAGTILYVRTIEQIRAKDTDGRVYSGVVAQDVMNRNGDLTIQKGSPVELIVRRISVDEMTVDLDSIAVIGQRYAVETEDQNVQSQGQDNVGLSKPTGKSDGRGAVLGAIIGAIAGGGKGAVTDVEGSAGPGAQLITRGKTVNVPADSLLTFRLSQPFRAGIADNGFTTNGVHYHR